jgi:energy-coupling factor transporter ATP-binding protein EcfA2
MRLRNRPLLVGGLDDDLYVSRPELEQVLHRALRDDRNVLLVGERGSGKTTLLRKVIADAPDREIKVVDAALASTVHDFIRLIGRSLGADPGPADAPADDPVDLLDALARLPRKPNVVVVIDGPLDPDVAYIFFGRLRDAVWRLPYTWIVTATPDEAGAFRTPPADAFWSLVLEVGNLGDAEIQDLLERAMDPDELARLNELGKSSRPISAPVRHVVRWAQDVMDGRSPTHDEELLNDAAALGRQASMALSELLALERPVSAGDPELLRRLGWTRTNAARWLARMEDRGIVRSFVGNAEGQGRPPKLYEPVRSR